MTINNMGLYRVFWRALIVAFVALLVDVGCVRDHLYYATSDQVVVRLYFDWSVSGFEPNGVTVYVYDSNGDRYGSSMLSSTTSQMSMTLPADTYTFVVHNDSRSEFSNVEFINSDKLSTFMVRSLEWDHPYYDAGDGEFVAYEPEDIVSATVRGVEVWGDAARYHYDKPDLSEYTSSEVIEVYITPAYIVHLAEVQAHIESAQNTVSIPLALVHGMSRGYYFGLECTAEQRVLEEFYIDIDVATSAASEVVSVTTGATTGVVMTKSEGYYNYEDDDIYLDFRTFGLPFDRSQGDSDGDGLTDMLDKMHSVDYDYHSVFVELLFTMYDGALYRVSADVTETVDVDDLVVRKKYTIALEDDLSDYEPYYDEDMDEDEGSSDAIIDPSVDNWVDVVVPLPL